MSVEFNLIKGNVVCDYCDKAEDYNLQLSSISSFDEIISCIKNDLPKTESDKYAIGAVKWIVSDDETVCCNCHLKDIEETRRDDDRLLEGSL